MKTMLSRVKIVLSRPSGAANIGSVCRAMKNMGLSRLVLADMQEIQDETWIRNMAVHAWDIYENAERYKTLEEALESSILSAGISRRRGSKRKYFSLLPQQLAEKISDSAEGDVAVVFGNEKHGLSDSEMDCCSLTCHIPSDDSFPSLNLSHAVQVITYELFKYSYDDTNKFKALKKQEVVNLTETIMQSLKKLGFFKPSDNFNMNQYWQDILSRAQLSRKESRYMENMFKRLQHIKRNE